ncbi:hypothetical protein F4811DRAFT_523228 [Daldinia bambusicola]|nr:hypothetical protein F4811DRAFT_523228 [Daldinia bambusicola]
MSIDQDLSQICTVSGCICPCIVWLNNWHRLEMAHLGLGDSVSRRVAELEHSFSKDRRFVSKGLLATGSYGFTIRVEVRDPNVPGLRNIVVKRARGGADARSNLRVERRFLERLQGNPHIVRIINLPDNPLGGSLDTRDWIILEWVEHGELRSFISKARVVLGRGQRLPARLLWRMFLCLIRCCVAMAVCYTYEFHIP